MELKNILLENEELHAKNEFLQRQVTALQLRCSKLSCELQDIKSLGVWEFANLYCTDEENAEAAHMLAKSLLRK